MAPIPSSPGSPDNDPAGQAPANHEKHANDTDLSMDESWDETGETDVSEDFDDCIDLIERVRDQSPNLINDLSPMVPDPTWLDGKGALPKKIGRFEIRRPLGHGGFGLVFLSFDPDLEREVALKVPRIETLVSQHTRERFLREAKAVAALNHPNIATVFESGHLGPICYIASAYYAGGSLADWLARKQRTESGFMNERAAARTAIELARGVQHAHSRGILHRDLKPSNILLDLPTDETTEEQSHQKRDFSVDSLSELVRITDFGLARFMDDSEQQTQSGALLGTPAYMSPEQAESRLDDISTASDVYSLGAILYEMLSGHPPFPRDSVPEVLEAVRHQDPTSIARLRPIDRDLNAIVLKCLEKHPSDRYGTAAELGNELERWLTGEPVIARSATNLERFARWCRRNPAVAGLIGVLGGAMVVIALVSVVSYWKISQAQFAEEQQRSRRDKNFQLAIQAVDSLLTKVAVNSLIAQPRMEGIRRELLEEAVAFYQAFLDESSNDPEILLETARAHQRLGNIYFSLNQFGESENSLKTSIKMLERLQAEFPARPSVTAGLAKAYRALAAVYAFTKPNELDNAHELVVKAIEHQRRLDGSHPSNELTLELAESYLIKGIIRDRTSGEGHSDFIKVIDVLKSPLKPNEVDLVALHTLRGRAFELYATSIRSAQPRDADRKYRSGLREVEAALALDPDHPDARILEATVSVRLAELMVRLGQEDRSQSLRTRGLELLSRLIVEFPSTPSYRIQLGYLKQHEASEIIQKRRFEEARQLLEESQEMFDQAESDHGEDIFSVQLELTRCKNGLTVIHFRLNQMREAQVLFQEVIAETDRLSRDPGDSSWSLTSLATLLYQVSNTANNLQQFDKCKQFLLQALEMIATASLRSQSNGSQRWAELQIRQALGYHYHIRQQHDEAAKQYLVAMKLAEELTNEFLDYPFYKSEFAQALAGAGLAAIQQRQLTEAEELMERAIRISSEIPNSVGPEFLAAVHYNLGNLFGETGRIPQSIASYRRAIEVRKAIDDSLKSSPNSRYTSTVIWGNLANQLQRVAKWDECLEARKRELALIEPLAADFPTNRLYQHSLRVTVVNLAQTMGLHPNPDKRDPPTALALAQRALDLGPKNQFAWRTLGIAQYRVGKLDEAIASLEKACSLPPRDEPLNYFFLSMCHHRKENQELADELRRRAVEAIRVRSPEIDSAEQEAESQDRNS